MNPYEQIILEFAKNVDTITFDDIKFSEEDDRDPVDPNKLIKKLASDKRFLKLGNEDKYGNLQFVKKEFLLNKLICLNIKLGRNCLNRISYKDFSIYFSSLIPKEMGKEDLELIIYFAGKFSLVYKGQNDFLFFPYSIIINNIYLHLNRYIFQIYKNNLNIVGKEISIIERIGVLIVEFQDTFFSQERSTIIFKERIASADRKGKTLEDLGNELAITRERVRQVESKLNEKLIINFKYLSKYFNNFDYKSEANIENEKIKPMAKLFEVIILLLISLKGSKIIGKEYFSIIHQINFFLKFLNIDILNNYFKNYYFIAVNKEVVSGSVNTIRTNKIFSFKEGQKLLSEQFGGHFIDVDINRLTKSIIENYKLNMPSTDAVYIALKSIGAPAHYSEISKKCIELFNDGEKFTPRNVLAYLNREALRRENDLPWVWVGIRGVYALKEQGYLQPEKILFLEIAGIVEREFAITKKPVSLSKIRAEVIKKRKIVNENSLFFACSINDELKYLSKIKCCVPIKYSSDFISDDEPEKESIASLEKQSIDEDFIDDVLSKYEN